MVRLLPGDGLPCARLPPPDPGDGQRRAPWRRASATSGRSSWPSLQSTLESPASLAYNIVINNHRREMPPSGKNLLRQLAAGALERRRITSSRAARSRNLGTTTRHRTRGHGESVDGLVHHLQVRDQPFGNLVSVKLPRRFVTAWKF